MKCDMKSLQLTRPHAIMMVGIPGSGKSFFARQFADTFSAPYVDSLAIEDRSATATDAGELITMVMNEIAKTGQTFLFEGNTDSRVRRTEFCKWARDRGYQPLVIWIQTDQVTSLKRCLKNETMNRTKFEDTLQDFSPPHPDEKPIVLSGKHTYASQARVVLTHLSQYNRPAQTQAPTPITLAQPVPPRTSGRPFVSR